MSSTLAAYFRLVLAGSLTRGTDARAAVIRTALEALGAIERWEAEPYLKDGETNRVLSGTLRVPAADSTQTILDRVCAALGSGWEVHDATIDGWWAVLNPPARGRAQHPGLLWASVDVPLALPSGIEGPPL